MNTKSKEYVNGSHQDKPCVLDMLEHAVQNFNKEAAEQLSDSIHEFEANGGELSSREDALWYQLTEKIMDTEGIGEQRGNGS